MRALTTTKKIVAGTVLVAGGFGAGLLLAVGGSASAATDSATTALTGSESGTTSGTGQSGQDAFDPSRSVRPDEHLLTGTTARQVTAAVTAKYPQATIQRVETDSDGVYEAHVVTRTGQDLIVQVGKDFTVTGTQSGGPGGHGGPGDHDGDGPAAPAPSSGAQG